MTELTRFRAFMALARKKPSAKTQTGREVGWMVGCSIALFLKKARLTKPRQFSFPRWSCVPLYAGGKNILSLLG